MESINRPLKVPISNNFKKIIQVLWLSAFLCLSAQESDAWSSRFYYDPLDEYSLIHPFYKTYGFLFNYFKPSNDFPKNFVLDWQKLGIQNNQKLNEISNLYNQYLLSISLKDESFVLFIEKWFEIWQKNWLNNLQIINIFEQYLSKNYIPFSKILFLEEMKSFYNDRFDEKFLELLNLFDSHNEIWKDTIQNMFSDFIIHCHEQVKETDTTFFKIFTWMFILCILMLLKTSYDCKKSKEICEGYISFQKKQKK